PVTVGEDSELAASDEAFELVLDRLELKAIVVGPGGKAFGKGGCLRGVRLQGRDNVYPVQGREVVELNDVVVERVGDHDQVADVLGVGRNLQADSILHRS